ncbi:hypothetical protein CYFUS_003445 [Cystobacter fuscus]|uniref:Uncharacterized protein n=1 Tax=Cystobacter fuscus TaxID=43 RepID=A0A250J203_9BACT|nr:hypothetical protein CYFUS_003445 [Cystobacter fuscus]
MPSLGQFKGYIRASHTFLSGEQVSCHDAQYLCRVNADANPSLSIYCTWKGTEVYRRETVPGICGP